MSIKINAKKVFRKEQNKQKHKKNRLNDEKEDNTPNNQNE